MRNKRQESDRLIAEEEERQANEPQVAGKCLCCRKLIIFDEMVNKPSFDLIGDAGIVEMSCGYGSKYDMIYGERRFGLLCDTCHENAVLDGRIIVQSWEERDDVTPKQRERTARWKAAQKAQNWPAIQQIQKEEDD
jgi:hypothetical protein